jgi:DNA invertase Pin-like site-specific DNA recombinase
MPNENNRVALYARVSTTDQNCELQVTELREYTRRRAWEIVREFVDTGWSGTLANRPEFDRSDAGCALSSIRYRDRVQA